MKITQQELMDIIREELTQIDLDAPPSEEEMRMDKLAGMIEDAVMVEMDDVISMISNHLVTTMGETDDMKLVRRALDMLEELGFKGLKPADAEKLMKEGTLSEKFEDEADIEQTGEYSDKSVGELRAMKKKLMDKPERTDAEQKKVRQLNFAIRAKTGWKKGEGATK
jgi:hypothetical protein